MTTISQNRPGVAAQSRRRALPRQPAPAFALLCAASLIGSGRPTAPPSADVAAAPPSLKAYYAHDTAEDRYGVIAPWHRGLNGQLDERATIAVDVYKRYPWVGRDKAVMAAPDFVYNSHWSIKPDGAILIPPTTDWMCGDLCQRAWSIVKGLTAYYQYSGDPVAFVYIPLTVDYILDYAQTPANAPWPRFPISTPTKGKAYGKCDPTARNQLDLCAITGLEVLRAHKLTGNPRYLAAARHWGDVFAQKCDFRTKLLPWGRYVDPSVVGWSDVMTGTTTVIVEFLDQLIDGGYSGNRGLIVRARDRGRAFVNQQMLPRWLVNDTWARTYWDWDNPIMCGMVAMCADHIMAHPQAYPTWRTDVRNMLSLLLNRNAADPNSMGDAYSGAWAFPESAVCCGTSLSYEQYTCAPTWVRYGALAKDPWAAEIGRRMILMATYDSQRNGVVKDGLLGEAVATGEWSNLAHPWPLCQTMEAMAWAPRDLAPNRENHIVRSTSVVTRVAYQRGRIAWRTFDARPGVTEVLRLAFVPTRVLAGGRPLPRRIDLKVRGYVVEKLPNGDAIVQVRHDGARDVLLTGADPQNAAGPKAFTFDDWWRTEGGTSRAFRADREGASASLTFTGTQVRVLGDVGPDGGWADAYLDGERLPTTVEFWCPTRRADQALFRRGGLATGSHTLRIVARGAHNPLAKGAWVRIAGAQWSAATGDAGCGSGGGPAGAQRFIFGYPDRDDYVDTHGNRWRPGAEFVVRSGYGADTVEKSWWTNRRSLYVGKTADPELYRFGVHAKEFWVNVTAAPGTYDVTLKFAETPLTPWLEQEEGWKPVLHDVTTSINGTEVLRAFQPSEAAGGTFRAVDRTYRGIRPSHGLIRIHFRGTEKREAMVQAIEIVPSRR